jgi:hypothetical protein
MSNYTQSTNFATKDSLPTGDPLKIVKGTEINTEFVNISTAIATKADLASPTFTGNVTGTFVGNVTGNLTGNVTGNTSGTAANVTGTVAVANGGTGATSFTSGALLKGAGTSAVSVASAADIVAQIGSTAVANATSAANGGVTSVNGSTGAVTVASVGVSQTWQNPTRSLNTNYTNSTGKPIMVNCSVKATDSGNSANAVVDGVTILQSYTVSCCGVPQISYFPLSFVVPNGSTYRVNGSYDYSVWAELR